MSKEANIFELLLGIALWIIIWLASLVYVFGAFDIFNWLWWVCLIVTLLPALPFIIRKKSVFKLVIAELKKQKFHNKSSQIIKEVRSEKAFCGFSTLIGTDLFRAQKVKLSNSALNQHVLVLGTTGSGKTSTVLNFVESAIQQGAPLIYIDGKGEDADGRKIINYAKNHNRTAYLFSTETQECSYNPIASGGYTSKKDRIVELREWSEEHYKKIAEGFLQTVFKVMDKCGVKANLATLSVYLDFPKLKNLVRDNEDKLDDPKALMNEILRHENNAKDLSSLKAEIQNFVESELGEVFKLDNGKPVIELEKIIKQKSVVYFSLPSTEFPSLAKLLGRLIINDLKAVINKTAKTQKKTPVFLIFDEFSVFAGEQVLNLINQGRSKGVHAILVTQCLSDIARGVSNNSDHFMNQVLENCNTYIIHRLNSYVEADKVSQLFGTYKKIKYTAQFDDKDRSQKGSARAVDAFNVHPNEIKNLRTGNAFVLSKTDHMARRIYARVSEINKRR